MRSIFVYNPESGNGKLKKHAKYIADTLSKKYGEVDIVPTTHSGHATALAKSAIGKYDYFFTAGGENLSLRIVNFSAPFSLIY